MKNLFGTLEPFELWTFKIQPALPLAFLCYLSASMVYMPSTSKIAFAEAPQAVAKIAGVKIAGAIELDNSETIVSSPANEVNSNPSFLPVWKLMTFDQKEQFIAGYLRGWDDAAKINEIAIEYTRDNPSKALDGLERLTELYKLPPVKPSSLVSRVDKFYSKAENAHAPLSQAVNSAR